MPRLASHGKIRQLVVHDHPVLILGGELANSTASSTAVLAEVWPKLVAANLNTVLVPIYWELIEPEEGEYDFGLLDAVIRGARVHGLFVVLLWFGAWKNSMSSYAPAWVKRDTHRFARVRLSGGGGMEMISVFSVEALAADRRAFAAMMRRVREVDELGETVLMVQVENEVGMLEEAREAGHAADSAFEGLVPEELLDHFASRRVALAPEVARLWEAQGSRRAGTWTEVFGDGSAADEVFMAWHYARWIDSVAAAGKCELDLPMFVNAALNAPGKLPGQYPSGGPLPHLFDVWRAGAPNIDFLSPDIYLPDFERWSRAYARPDNAVFIPEAKLASGVSAHAIFTIGALKGLGFSPFAIDGASGAVLEELRECYAVLGSISPSILEHQRGASLNAVLLDHETPSARVTLGDYHLEIRHDWTFPWAQRDPNATVWPRVGVLVLALGSAEFLVAGSGVIVTFEPAATGRRYAGILSIDEGEYRDGQWVAGRRLNGDESHQGRHLRIPFGKHAIQRVLLYDYD